MIKSFRDNRTEALFTTGQGDKKWQSFDRVARRKLLMVDAASSLRDLKSPPANKLEALKDDRSGQHAIRIKTANTASVLFGPTVMLTTLRWSITTEDLSP